MLAPNRIVNKPARVTNRTVLINNLLAINVRTEIPFETIVLNNQCHNNNKITKMFLKFQGWMFLEDSFSEEFTNRKFQAFSSKDNKIANERIQPNQTFGYSRRRGSVWKIFKCRN